MGSFKSLKYIKTAKGLDFYRFKPRFGYWYFKNWYGYQEDIEKHTISHWLRMCLEWLEGGYRIYYFASSGVLCGYALVAKGGRRLKCTSKRDIVLGPYYTPKKFRGGGYHAKGNFSVAE